MLERIHSMKQDPVYGRNPCSSRRRPEPSRPGAGAWQDNVVTSTETVPAAARDDAHDRTMLIFVDERSPLVVTRQKKAAEQGPPERQPRISLPRMSSAVGPQMSHDHRSSTIRTTTPR